ncbi:MAG: tol-pal system protein YbgF [Pseudomonadota bacterium]
MIWRFVTWSALAVVLAPSLVFAQQDQTLADIRQELNFLYVEVQKLKRELSTTGAGDINTSGSSVLERMGAMESELQRLTAKTEQLENRIDRVVADGTTRIADLEFRLVELEGGDVTALGETTTLGGGDLPSVSAPSGTAQDGADQASLAVGEAADFQRAQDALGAGEYQAAVKLFGTFKETYPGGPLAAEADLLRGQALDKIGDTREAARAFLASFSTAPTGQFAPAALYELGRALGQLGQTQEACVTLAEVSLRFPNATAVSDAQVQRQTLGCEG